jgi:hypothetical protein
MKAIEFHAEKLLELIQYFATRAAETGDQTFGRTKLAKLLYYTDFGAYREWGEPVTGVTYGHLPYGPCPNSLEFYETVLVAEGSAVQTLVPMGEYEQKRLQPTGPFVRQFLSASEIRHAEAVFDRLRRLSASQVSDLSHDEPGWIMTDLGETIPYSTAVLSCELLTATENAKIVELIRELESIG